MSAEPCLAVIPVKPLHIALGRLADTLTPEVRWQLQYAMLADVLMACRRSPGIAALVVTADPSAAALARRECAEVVVDHVPPRGMNAAVRLGLARVATRCAGTALVLTADLPLIRSEDLASLVRAAAGRPGALLVPSRDGTGTNALLLNPPDVLEPELGHGSLSRHLLQAVRRACPVRCIGLPGVALDIDTPEDLAVLMATNSASRARRLMESELHEHPLAAVGGFA